MLYNDTMSRFWVIRHEKYDIIGRAYRTIGGWASSPDMAHHFSSWCDAREEYYKVVRRHSIREICNYIEIVSSDQLLIERIMNS